jgi:membrane associated rhomboid family serine protease
MVQVICNCGAATDAHESQVGQTLTCEKCGGNIALVAAEQLPEGAGGGDFDRMLRFCDSPQNPKTQILLGGVPDIAIGKLPDNPIVLTGKLVSRFHCKLVRLDFGPSRWQIVDNKSTNGIFVNDHRVLEHELKPGDRIRIGEHQLEFAATPALVPAAAPKQPGDQTCPSCGKNFSAKSKICISCGIDLKTGRAIVVSKGLDEDALAIRADTWIRVASWFMPFGLFPIASEAFGTKKPTASLVIAALTAVASLAFFIAYLTTPNSQRPDPAIQNLMQWNGQPRSPAQIAQMQDELEAKLRAIRSKSIYSSNRTSDAEIHRLVTNAIQRSLPGEGVEFHWYQPFTAAMLHDVGGVLPFIFHFGGNMVFFFVFGLRVNELIGNLRFAIIYPLLAFAAGMVDHVMHFNSPMTASLGASGAIMGLAGMYFIFFPVQKVHMAIWLRLGIFTRWRCLYKLFRMRGFWLLVMWVGLNDILPTVLGSRDHVAHWAHLGGFVFGALAAIFLLITRQTTARGTDILSVALGKRAWALLGKPTDKFAAEAQLA